MTVSQLIDKLKDCDQNASVYFDGEMSETLVEDIKIINANKKGEWVLLKGFEEEEL